MSGAVVVAFLAQYAFFRSKKVEGQKSSLSEAAVNAKSTPGSTSKHDDDVTVESARSYDM
jgi:hypothetical protein